MVGLFAMIGEAIGAVRDGFRWWADPQGREQWQKEKQGKKLEAKANEAFNRWMADKSDENWKAYQDAKNALVRHSVSP